MYPVKVSDNGRYFVDQEGAPVFWLGTTQWQLVRDQTLAEATLVLEKSAGTGFTVAQVMLLGPGDGTKPNVHGDKPWVDDDPRTPNEAYFRHVDDVVEVARQKNVLISMTLYHQSLRERITEGNARVWATWLARRYHDAPAIIWSMTPQAKPEFVPVLRELAAGLQAGDGGSHLISCKPDPGPFSSSFITRDIGRTFHAEPWLAFEQIQTWTFVRLIYPLVAEDYALEPVKPVVMAEGAYEEGTEYGFEVTPLWVRRQAWYSYLAGGHHTYGHNDTWRMLPTWPNALDAPGAAQLGLLRRILEERQEWWHLVPDQSLLARGGQSEGEVLNLAARHRDGRWALVYAGAPASFDVEMSKLAGTAAEAFWIDPRSAQRLSIGRTANNGRQSFSTPEGWEDALLVMEAVG